MPKCYTTENTCKYGDIFLLDWNNIKPSEVHYTVNVHFLWPTE